MIDWALSTKKRTEWPAHECIQQISVEVDGSFDQETNGMYSASMMAEMVLIGQATRVIQGIERCY